MIRAAIVLVASTALAGCATISGAGSSSLDDMARDYLALQLAIGEKDPGYIDAYFGPEDLKAVAEDESAETSLAQLQDRVAELDDHLAATVAAPDSQEAERVRHLRNMLGAAAVRLRMLQGETLSFQDEAEGLFGVRPELVDLATLDPILARIEALLPRDDENGATLGERVNAFRDRFIIPDDRLSDVIDAAVAECRRRTLDHVELPAGERFDLSLVTDKPWGGFNYYQGDYRSVIEINTDLPTRLDRAVEVGCHEAYPGHHVYSTLLERERVERLGQIEYTVMPLYSPKAIIAEGSADYGVKLAFPGDEQIIFERDVLAPLAGLDTADIADYYALGEATRDLGPAYYTIAAGYLDGTRSREQTIADLMRYQLQSRERAEQSLRFLDTYRSYVINYDLGREIVGDYVETEGDDQETRWRRFLHLLTAAVVPSDLR